MIRTFMSSEKLPKISVENPRFCALSCILRQKLARGQHVPEPIENQGFSGKLVVRLPKSLHRKATHAAAREGVSLNQFIANSVAEQVGVCSSRGFRYLSSSSTSTVRSGLFVSYITTDLHSTSGSVGASGPGFSRLPFDDSQMIDFQMERPGWPHAGY